MRMSRADFCDCTPSEFSAAYTAWSEHEDALEKARWERMRTLAAISIQPHVKSRITPRRLIPMPWDKPIGKSVDKAPQLSADEQKRRFEELAKKF